MSVNRVQLEEAVRKILLEHWDPVGVRDYPAASSEYDSYAPRIARMLMENADPSNLAAYLLQVETASMGLPGDTIRCEQTARTLAATFQRMRAG